MKSLSLLALLALPGVFAQPYTRGVGVYPGDPRSDFSPTLAPDPQTYRNLALHRAAYQSSSYDFNLTAQLVTDGIKDTRLPRTVAVLTSDHGPLSRQDREHALDHNVVTQVTVAGSPLWIEVDLNGGDAPTIDRIDVTAATRVGRGPALPAPSTGTYVVLVSDDARTWTEIARGAQTPAGRGSPGPVSIRFPAAAHNRMYRVALDGAPGVQWNVAELAFYNQDSRVEVGGPYNFTSAWKPASTGQEWVYVDLGAPCTFDRVVLSWMLRAAEGQLQTSDDAKTWRPLASLPIADSPIDDIALPQPARGRYVRLLLTRSATPAGYLLSEFEVYGRGGPVPHPHAAVPVASDGRLQLSGGAWRLQRDSLVAADGATLSKPGFVDNDWLIATVPATVLSSYLNLGAIPDPNYADNINSISDSYFYADFWYRTEFATPAFNPGRIAWLNFRGINWKADVFLNGQSLGRIDGGFLRGRFDVTALLQPGARNALAIRIHKNATPGSTKEKTWENPDKNGGALGADNPTYHATVGWDWIPTVRGRDIGIWSDVYLETTGPVTIENPYVSTTLPLPDTTRADVAIEATVRNHAATRMTGVLRGRFGDVAFEAPVALDAGAETLVKFNPATTPALRLQNPKLWWPNGYGAQNLYGVSLAFQPAGYRVSDTKRFRAGVRQFTYTGEGSEPLRIFINGRRFVARGGNWGFPEVNLRYRAREYDAAVRYHQDMNFTMIRNWVGQTGDDEFWDATDKYGIVVWQDFWLANPYDGPNPDDHDLFLKNSQDFLLRIRNHPSIGLFCGRNEGNPPLPLDEGLRAQIAAADPAIRYIPHSASGGVSGEGPYRTVPPKQYFLTRATPKLHSEVGLPNIVTYDSVKQMMPEAAMWPQGNVWGIHDFTLTGAQGATSWLDMVEKNYGGAANAADWVELSQFIDYDGYRAVFEAQGKNRMGVLLWMSHPCWPSFVWQTYDYYLDPSAGYFGSKKGSEPLHIQWNPVSDNVEVVNYSAGPAKGLTAHAELLNMDGTRKWEKTAAVDSAEDSVEAPIHLDLPADLTPVYFIRLKLTRGADTLSENFYLRGVEETSSLGYNLRAIRTLPKVKLESATQVTRQGDRWLLTTRLTNHSTQPALMVRVKAVRERSGDRILPAIFSDNYVALMPGETRTIRTGLDHADTRGERPRIVVEGFNIE